MEKLTHLYLLGIIFSLVVVINGYEDKVPGAPSQKLECWRNPADIVLILDSSRSIWAPQFKKQLQFVKDLVDQLDVGMGPSQTRLGVMSFSNWAQIEINLYGSANKEELKREIDNITQLQGNTNTGDALRLLRKEAFKPEQGSRSWVRHLGIILTDGESQDKSITQLEAQACKDSKIILFAIGIGDRVSYHELRGIASNPKREHFILTPNYDALVRIQRDILKKACKVDKVPGAPSQKLECLRNPADIVLILDSSSSIWAPHFKKQLQFVKELVDQLDVGMEPSQTRLGVMSFSDWAQTEINLYESTNKEELKRKIDNIPQLLGNTNTGDALRLLRKEAFKPGQGSRSWVRHLGIILTDGESQDKSITQLEAQACKDSKIILFAIGIGDRVNDQELQGIASNPKSEHFILTPNYDALGPIRQDILKKACKVVVPDSTTIRTSPTTTHQTTTETSSTTPITTNEIPIHDGDCKDKVADIFFLLDSSSSIPIKDFKKLLDVIEDIVKQFDIGPSKTRVGLSVFSHEYYPQLKFDDGNTTEEILKIIGDIKYVTGATKTGKALREMRIDEFNGKSTRPGVDKIVILFTDGQSSDRDQASSEARQLKESGVKIFMVGIGPFFDMMELEDLASRPAEDFIHTFKTFDELLAKSGVLSKKTCTVGEQILVPDQELVPDSTTTRTSPTTTHQTTTVRSSTTPITTNEIPIHDGDCKDKLADIFFLLDSSSSIPIGDLKKMSNVIEDIVKQFDIGPSKTRVGLSLFSDEYYPQLKFDDGNSTEEILKIIGNITYLTGTTKTGKALREMRIDEFNGKSTRPGVDKIVILFTDGQSSDRDQASSEAKQLKESGVKIFMVGIGPFVNRTELEDLASRPAEDFFHTFKTFDELLAKSGVLSKKTCTVVEQIIVPDQEIVPDPTTIRTSPTTTHQTTTVRSSTTPITTNEIPIHDGDCKDKVADIFFLLDSSSSIRPEEFKKLLDVIEDIVKKFDIGPSKTRVGLSVFSHEYYPQLNFNDGNTKEEILKVIGDIKYLGGGTKTGKALHEMRIDEFNIKSTRPWVDKIVILFTDGQSFDPDQASSEAKQLKESGVKIFMVGIGPFFDRMELEDLASRPAEDFIHTFKTFDELLAKSGVISKKTCTVGEQILVPDQEITVCNATQMTDVVFMVSDNHFGKAKTERIFKASVEVVRAVGSRGRFRFGILFEECLPIQDVKIGSVTQERQLVNVHHGSLSSIVRQLRIQEFSPSDYIRKVGLLFLDSTIQLDDPQIQLEVKRAIFKDIQFYVVVVGEGVDVAKIEKTIASKDRILFIDSYDNIVSYLPVRFMDNLCTRESNSDHVKPVIW